VSGQQQYFRIQPKDVKVHEGGEAMLECEVTNQAGQVQWTKDGFALGNSLHVSIHYIHSNNLELMVHFILFLANLQSTLQMEQ
jgi:hypothetical protein